MGSNEQELLWSLPSTPTHIPPQQLFLAVSQLPVVRSEHVRTLFDSTQSQKYKSEVRLCTTHFKTHFVSLVQSRCVKPFFASTESQESKSEIGAHEF